MKNILLALLICASSAAMADTTSKAKQTNTSSSTSAAEAAANNTGGNLTISAPLVVQEASVIPTETTANVKYSGTQTVKNVPSVSGPPLTSSNDTCMGSASGSVNAPGFGVSLGKTYTDANCVMLKNSRELWNMGMKAAALALMCTDEANRTALELTGYECPQTTKARENKNEQYTDPIVRHRLGLPPLK